MPGQPGVDHPRKLDVVKGESARSNHDTESHNGEQAKSKGRGPKTLLKSNSQRNSPRAGQLLLSRNKEKEQSRSSFR
jgi:hypothetical protein